MQKQRNHLKSEKPEGDTQILNLLNKNMHRTRPLKPTSLRWKPSLSTFAYIYNVILLDTLAEGGPRQLSEFPAPRSCRRCLGGYSRHANFCYFNFIR